MSGTPSAPDTEPHWRSAQLFSNVDLPQKQRSWLLDDGSLTERLITTQAGDFTVQRLRQSWATPYRSERNLLGIGLRQKALIREVALQINGQAVVFGRSIFPAASLAGELRHLRHLQNRPLGAILFRYPSMQRSPFELAHIPGDNDLLPATLRQEQAVWGRRSCFDIKGKRLLVSEVFLSAFQPWQALLPIHRSQRGKVSAAILRAKQ
ncbi:chorismate lyase [Parahaliea sp. F7430]|uniref:Probable chorismate pyruvate-lyase n=1 Tax=Sediminihaliea albiluteola TaxID=2758564 RepID=A0A7W2TX86_9GAMM|nr:chorismate lyase [Sediminihaliea albiluteola]MBA6413619.1 chorismate lyase [Sediminihaliea albiluteola]